MRGLWKICEWWSWMQLPGFCSDQEYIGDKLGKMFGHHHMYCMRTMTSVIHECNPQFETFIREQVRQNKVIQPILLPYTVLNNEYIDYRVTNSFGLHLTLPTVTLYKHKIRKLCNSNENYDATEWKLLNIIAWNIYCPHNV